MAGAFRRPLRRALGMVTLALVLGPAGPSQAGVLLIGRLPSLPRPARSIGQLPGRTRMHLTITLEPRDPAALAAYARAVSDPTSASYRRYLSPRQFGRRFGASGAQVAVVRRALRARGLDPGPVSAGHLSVAVTATAAEVRRGLSISLGKQSLSSRRSAVAAGAPASLGSRTARLVQSIIGLDTVSAPRPLLVRPLAGAPAAGAGPPAGPVATGGPVACSEALATAAGQNAHTADQIASAYDFSGLYGAGDRGGGVTVAVYELEPNLPGDISAYQSCYGTHASVAYVPVDGGVGSGPGSGEAALDVENLIGLAPAAHLIVYQGPNSNSGAPGSGPYDTFSAIVNQDRARVVSVSWGECEAALGAGNAQAENSLFEQAAIEGQSIVAASGDSGAEDCASSVGLPQTAPAVDDPASQPYVTGVGGTTLTSVGPPPAETVWNAGGSLAGGPLAPGAGGGGVSSLWAMPAAQLDAAPGLNVLAAGQTGSQCGHPGGYCREVPDVSADADPATGYAMFWNGDGSAGGQPSGWQSVGGTSGATPVWAALLALADASPGCSAASVGFANPALYRAAGDAYAANFHDVRSGENDFTGTNGGRFAAGPGYDEASGLGTPDAAVLAAGLCADRVHLSDPGPHRSASGTSVSLALRGQDTHGTGLRFQSTNLPPGLALNRASGRISGRPRRTGVFAVTATARDSAGSAATVAFTWQIGGPPAISALTLEGVAIRRPQLSFTVAAGPGSPALRQLTIRFPASLQLTSTTGLTLAAPAHHHPRFTARLGGGTLEIRLGRSLAELRLGFRYPHLRTIAGRLAQARHRRRPASELGVAIVDSGAGTATLHSKLSPSRSG